MGQPFEDYAWIDGREREIGMQPVEMMHGTVDNKIVFGMGKGREAVGLGEIDRMMTYFDKAQGQEYTSKKGGEKREIEA